MLVKLFPPPYFVTDMANATVLVSGILVLLIDNGDLMTKSEKYYFYVHLNRKRSTRIEILRIKDRRVIGGFTEGKEVAISSKEPLDGQCLFEIDWYKDCLEFNRDNFGASVLDVERIRLYLSPNFFSALVKLSVETKERGIKFAPVRKMLKALLEEAKRAERDINLKDGQPIGILSKLGIKVDEE